MGRTADELTALEVTRLRTPGTHGVGRGLYLQITATGSRSWVHRYMFDGKAREMGLGSFLVVSLKSAKAKVDQCRRLRDEGLDPIATIGKRAKAAQRRLETATATTFRDAASRYIASHQAGWRNAKHAAQWSQTLDDYAHPVLGDLSIKSVDTGLVMKVLDPIWAEKPETASRVRGRIEAVLDWAAARGFRSGDNPARWRGHLAKLLPAKSKVRRVKHHAALPYVDLPAFLGALREQAGVGARALEFTILTAARTGEVIGARWSELDMARKLWTVPGERMKGGREHRVPLSARALEILDQMKAARNDDGDFIFPGGKTDRPLSNMAMTAVLRRMARGDLTVHGFRSTFRDWARERTNFPREIAETALAHVVGDKTEAAYLRGDALEKRRRLMDAWSDYANKPAAAGAVVPLRAAV